MHRAWRSTYACLPAPGAEHEILPVKLMWARAALPERSLCLSNPPCTVQLRFRRALWNQAALLLASAAVSLPAVCGLPDAIKPPRLCFGLGTAMEAAAFVLPLVAVHLLERRARNNFLQSPAALLPHAG